MYRTLLVCANHIFVSPGASQDDIEIIRNPTGVLVSHDRSKHAFYDDNTDMMWLIEMPEQRIIRYEIEYLELEESFECHSYVLRVKNIFILL